MYCGKCGQEIPDHSVFCGKCGAKLQDTGNKNSFDSIIDVKVETDKAKNSNKFSNASIQKLGRKKSRKLIIGVMLVVPLWLVISNVINRNHVHGSSEEAVTPAVMESTKETSFSEEPETQYDLQEYVIQENQTETEDPVETSTDVQTEEQQGSLSEQDLENLSVGAEVIFGTYEQDGDSSNGAEPVPWIVMDQTDEGYLLISKYILDCGPYYGYAWDRWEHAALRTWLNGTFYNTAFSQTEKEQMLTMELTNSYDYEFGTADTIVGDPVVILNTADIEYYFPSAAKRQARTTAYVRSKGLWTDQDGYGSWWVREDITVTAWMVNHLGNLCDAQEYKEYGIRPVIYLSLNE